MHEVCIFTCHNVYMYIIVCTLYKQDVSGPATLGTWLTACPQYLWHPFYSNILPSYKYYPLTDLRCVDSEKNFVLVC